MAAKSNRSHWLWALRRYIVVSAVGHLAWEFLHMPLYTIWEEGTTGEIVFAAIHCTGGDILIALAVLTTGLVLAGDEGWPFVRHTRVALMTIVLGVGYTIFSEWLNVNVREAWAYAPAMPTIPYLGTGLTPTAQWIVVPLVALCAAYPKNASTG